MTVENIIKNCKIGTIIYYHKQILVKISKNQFANENIILNTENIIKTIINLTKIIEPVQTKITNNEQLLTYDERIYLANVIKPFRHRVYSIEKGKKNKYDYINIKINNLDTMEIEDFILPKFDEYSMFKNLKYNKDYTLKELYL